MNKTQLELITGAIVMAITRHLSHEQRQQFQADLVTAARAMQDSRDATTGKILQSLAAAVRTDLPPGQGIDPNPTH